MHYKKEIQTHHTKIDKELLDKFHNGFCDEEETRLVEKWYADVENSKEIKEWLKPVWDNTPDEGSNNKMLDDLLYKILYQINNNKDSAQNRFKLIHIAAAVSIAIIFLAAGYWLGAGYEGNTKSMYTKLYAPYGSRIRFELPDGSNGWLNSGSSLKYPVRFTGKTRKVFLQGEGFFNVEHNPEKPFIVQTKDTKVTALGTSFNVQAYCGNEREVTLLKGIVVVERKDAGNTYKELLHMKPGQHVKINVKTGGVVTNSKDPEKYVSWKDGILMFRNDPLSRVVKEMELFYNVNIEIMDPKLYQYHFHATFEDETLFEALRLLKISSGIEYKICKREKNDDGTFKKRKVKLYAEKI